MISNYKKMMAQHGGYIPFSVLGGSSKRTSRVRMKTGKKKTGKMKTNKKTTRLNTTKYAVGTIIRKNNQLVMLSNQRQWQPVKFT